MLGHVDIWTKAYRAVFASASTQRRFVEVRSRLSTCLCILLLLSVCTTCEVSADDDPATLPDPMRESEGFSVPGLSPEEDDRDMIRRERKRERDRRERLNELRDRDDSRDARRDDRKDDTSPKSDGDDMRDDDNRRQGEYDGSQFNAPSFVDTDFRKKMFRDSFHTDTGNVMNLSPLELFDDAMKRITSMDDRILSSHDEIDDRDAKDPDSYTWRQLTKPVDGMLHDWVPSDPDPLHNGGFGLDDDNGRPVPYRLNGHLDLERGLPWKRSN